MSLHFTRRLALVLVAPVFLVPALLGLGPSPASVGRPRSCVDAQLIADELLCDDEQIEASSPGFALCPFGPARGLGPGDALARWSCQVERMPPDQLAALEQVVDINEASAVELASLPGIGPAIAARIIAGRPHASVEALLEVRGIGPARLTQLQRRARVRSRPR